MSDVDPTPELPDLVAIEAELRAVDRALVRLEDGSYAECTVCGDPIDDAVLTRDPLVERCARHERTAPSIDDETNQTASESTGVASV